MQQECKVEAEAVIQYFNASTQALERSRNLKRVLICVDFPTPQYRPNLAHKLPVLSIEFEFVSPFQADLSPATSVFFPKFIDQGKLSIRWNRPLNQQLLLSNAKPEQLHNLLRCVKMFFGGSGEAHVPKPTGNFSRPPLSAFSTSSSSRTLSRSNSVSQLSASALPSASTECKENNATSNNQVDDDDVKIITVPKNVEKHVDSPIRRRSELSPAHQIKRRSAAIVSPAVLELDQASPNTRNRLRTQRQLSGKIVSPLTKRTNVLNAAQIEAIASAHIGGCAGVGTRLFGASTSTSGAFNISAPQSRAGSFPNSNTSSGVPSRSVSPSAGNAFASFSKPANAPPTIDESTLSSEQRHVLALALGGVSLFFSGSAGTGKSHLLRVILSRLEKAHPIGSVFATASTGVAAVQIGGTTLHHFAGVGGTRLDTAPVTELASQLRMHKSKLQSWQRARVLVIDEISMIDGVMFEKLEQLARELRHNSAPFGGIQLILCGDFFQLPPVSKPGQNKPFCFEVKAWDSVIQHSIELKQVFRQADNEFVRLLNRLRWGVCTAEMAHRLRTESGSDFEKHDGIEATTLNTHKADVEQRNRDKLDELEGEKVVLMAADTGEPQLLAQLQASCPARAVLELKVGAQVLNCCSTSFFGL
jgi:hypothetical protein